MIQHTYDVRCSCEDCVRQTFANRHGQPMEHEIIGAGSAQVGDVSSHHEVIGNPQSQAPRSSGYGA